MTEQKSNPTPIKQRLLFIFLVAIAFAALLWINLRFFQLTNAGSDFLTRWLPVQLMVYEGVENPYADEVSYQIQLLRYGRAALPHEAPGLFAYPFYIVPFILPFALIKDSVIARALWMLLLQVCHLSIVFLSLRLCNYRPSKSVLLFLLIFSLLSADMAQTLIDGNVASLAAFFTTLSLFFIYKEWDNAAGIALALSTIKPQLVILFIPLIILWAFSQRRWKIILSSAVAFATMIIIAFAIYPGWLSAVLHQLRVYTDVASPSTPNAIFSYWMAPNAANLSGWILTIISIVLLLYAWVNCYQKDFMCLFWAACLTFTLMPITGITSAKSNYVAMLPAIVLLMKFFIKHNKMRPWQWLSGMSLYIIASWFFFWAGRFLYIGTWRLLYVDFYHLPIILLIGLFAIRKKCLVDTPANGQLSGNSN